MAPTGTSSTTTARGARKNADRKSKSSRAGSYFSFELKNTLIVYFNQRCTFFCTTFSSLY